METMPEVTLDDAQIEEAVAWINNKVAETVFRGSVEIGRYILEKFYDNHIELALAKNGNKTVSFRKLCKHPDISLSASSLSIMVRVAAQESLLIECGIPIDQLNFSQKAELIKVDEVPEKISLAKECVSESLSYRQLAERIREILDDNEGEGEDPQTEAIVKYFSKLEKAVKRCDLPAEWKTEDGLWTLSPGARWTLRDEIGALLEEMSGMYSDLSQISDRLDVLIEQTAEGEGGE